DPEMGCACADLALVVSPSGQDRGVWTLVRDRRQLFVYQWPTRSPQRRVKGQLAAMLSVLHRGGMRVNPFRPAHRCMALRGSLANFPGTCPSLSGLSAASKLSVYQPDTLKDVLAKKHQHSHPVVLAVDFHTGIHHRGQVDDREFTSIPKLVDRINEHRAWHRPQGLQLGHLSPQSLWHFYSPNPIGIIAVSQKRRQLLDKGQRTKAEVVVGELLHVDEDLMRLGSAAARCVPSEKRLVLQRTSKSCGQGAERALVCILEFVQRKRTAGWRKDLRTYNNHVTY
ncbi:MAG: hypothetical protein JWN35_30, partial [Frankiales bacterium]|nr:hypothetical protein [Frankiales bacterium]